MFHWTNYRCHVNTAVNIPALNNGFDLLKNKTIYSLF